MISELEKAIDLGEFIPYNRSWDFVRDLQDVKHNIDALVKDGQAERAVSLYEIFLSGCYEKADEIDDSGGNLGMFFEDLFCAWINARQKAKHDPEETVQNILSWMDNDNYGFCYEIERDMVKVLNKKSVKSFEAAIKSRLEKAFVTVLPKKNQRVFDYPWEVRKNVKHWHQKALEKAKDTYLSGFIDICTKTKEWDKLADHISSIDNEQLEELSHYTTEKAAKGLAKKYGIAAAKIYSALGMRILIKGKSKYYRYALEHFRKVHKLYEKAGRDQLWMDLVDRVRRHHSRKYSFIPDFEKIVAGRPLKRPESFETRTLKRWKKQIS